MSSDDEDFVYKPLQRSQISVRESKPDVKPSKLSSSFRRSQTAAKKTKTNTTPSKPNKNRTVKKETPIKSRADHPEENCSDSKRAQWYFLYGSQPDKEYKKPQPLKRKNDLGGESSRDYFPSPSQQKKKTVSEKRELCQDDQTTVYFDPPTSKLPPSSMIEENAQDTPKCVPQSTLRKREDVLSCVYCKFPYNTVQENSLHAFLCQSKNLSQLPRCDAGSRCWETTEGHFWKYSHNEKSLETKLLSNDTTRKTNPLRNLLMNTDSKDSFTNDSGYNGVDGPSKSNGIDGPSGYNGVAGPSGYNGVAGPSGYNGVAGPSGYNGVAGPSGYNGVAGPSGYNGVAGPSGFRVPSMAATSDESPDIIMLSDIEESTLCADHNSMPLFDLQENESHKAPTDKESPTSEDSQMSSNLLDSAFVPDIELHEDDQSTICFDQPSSRLSSPPMVEEDAQDNPESPLKDRIDDSSGSETPDSLNTEMETPELDDPEGDELIASVAEEALDTIGMPVLEKVMKWKKDSNKEAHTSTPVNEKRKQSRRLSESRKGAVQPICIHLHYHEASPSPSTSKENGQTSILTYFKPTKLKEQSCQCGEKNTVSRQENIAAWQGVMDRMQNKKLVPLPSVSELSSPELSPVMPTAIQPRSNATKRRWGRNGATATKNCPSYKYIPETGFAVDAFNYGSLDGVTAYFLSHFHYDHYIGLRKNFSHPIYCSEITAKLVNKKIGVSLQYLNPLPMWTPQQVCGVEVTLLDANHCPGAVMFLFKVKPGVTHLHVGDFRAHPFMERYPALLCPINTLFLDTTYCSPEHVFPTQEKMIEKCVSLAQDHHNKNNNTLFVVGSYTIGKEKVFKAIASSLKCSIWVKPYKRQVLNCINDKDIQARLTPKKTNAKVHVLTMSEVKGEKLKDYLNELSSSFSEIVGMCPTGWSFTSGAGLGDITSEHPYPNVYIYGIPYSEHSSFSELRQFVQFIKPGKIIPTVNNGNKASQKKMEQHFREWQTTDNS